MEEPRSNRRRALASLVRGVLLSAFLVAGFYLGACTPGQPGTMNSNNANTNTTRCQGMPTNGNPIAEAGTNKRYEEGVVVVHLGGAKHNIPAGQALSLGLKFGSNPGTVVTIPIPVTEAKDDVKVYRLSQAQMPDVFTRAVVTINGTHLKYYGVERREIDDKLILRIDLSDQQELCPPIAPSNTNSATHKSFTTPVGITVILSPTAFQVADIGVEAPPETAPANTNAAP
jgi:hypothetical protein